MVGTVAGVDGAAEPGRKTRACSHVGVTFPAPSPAEMGCAQQSKTTALSTTSDANFHRVMFLLAAPAAPTESSVITQALWIYEADLAMPGGSPPSATPSTAV